MNKVKSILGNFNPRHNGREAMKAISAVVGLSIVLCATVAIADVYNPTLTVTINTALTFNTLSTTNSFANVTPGTPGFATTTLVVATNDVGGYNITLSGTNKGTGTNNLQSGSYNIPDQTEWIPNAATTSAGSGAAQINSLANSGNVLAFRVMTASTTNGVPLVSTAWWGTTDSYTNSATTLWAGIPSSTVARQIGYAGNGSYSSSNHINTVLYYLNVAATQATGAYSAPLVYTATGN